MSTFVLVHGAWHGAWCWEKVVPLLEAAGHRVMAIDLPGHGEDGTPMEELNMDSYAYRVAETVNAEADPVVLVGHSLGGVSLTHSVDLCHGNLKCLVFLAAWMMPSGNSRLSYGRELKGSLVGPNVVLSDDELFATVREDALAPAFYHDCTQEDIDRAVGRLSPEPMSVLLGTVQYTPEIFESVPRWYIQCTEDRAIPFWLQEQLCEDLPPTGVFTMDTSHSPFYSAPQELAGYLLQIGS